MQNIDVRFSATSNFSKVRADLAALEAQASSLNSVLNSKAYATPPAVIDRNSWKIGSNAVNMASRAFREAASSSGLLYTQQIKATSEAENYTKALQKQKLTLGDMRKHQGILKQVYQDQLRYQRMAAQYWGTDTSGRAVTDIAIPKNVPKDLDNMANKLGFASAKAASAGRQFINMGKNIQWAGRQLTVGFTYPVVLFGAATAVAAYKAEQGFASINKVYDVSAQSLVSLSARERELGQLRSDSLAMATTAAEKYGSTLDSTLKVEQELAATGLRGQNLLSTTKEVQRISSLGNIDPSQTTQMVIALQTAFRSTIKPGADTTNMLNYMNAAANATSLSLQDIADATPRAASGLASLGVNAKEMTVMLVAMREAGINASEGAQALKSATARILNPTILAKATKAFSSFGSKIDVGAISKQSNGNFYEFIQLLGKAEAEDKKLSAQQKASANAALFGTYQFNRLTAVLKNVYDATHGVNNQTAAAIGLMGQSNEQLAKTAEESRKAMMNNPAGRFRIEWAKLRIELIDVGNSFLKVANTIMPTLTFIFDKFNGAPKWFKYIALGAAGLLALAGPVIMLTGLFFNMWGQIEVGAARAVGAYAKMKGWIGIVTKQEQAAKLTAEAQNKAYMSQTEAVSTLAEEMNVLAASYRAATKEAVNYINQATGVGGGTAPVTPSLLGPNGKPIKPIAGTGYQPTQQEAAYMSTISNQGTNGKFISEETHLMQARNKMAYDYMRANNQVARDATVNQQKTAAIARQTEAIDKNVTGARVAGAAMAISMGTMMVNSNKVLDSVMKWVLVSSIVLPAVKGLAAATNIAAKGAWSYAAGMQAGAVAAGEGAVASEATAGAGALRGIIGGVARVGSLIGPGGAILLGVTAITAGFLAWRHHLAAVRAEQERVAKSVNDMTKTWAEGAGIAAQKYKEMKTAQQDFINGENQQKTVDAYTSGPFKQTMTDFKGLQGNDQDRAALQHYLELQVKYGLSAQQAAGNIAIMYGVAGRSAQDANAKAKVLLGTFGNMGKAAINNQFLYNQIDIFKNATPGTKQATSAAKDTVEAFRIALGTAGPKMRQQLIKTFSGAALTGWDKSLQDIVNFSPAAQAALQKAGIKTGEQLRAAVNKAGSGGTFLANMGIIDPGQLRQSFAQADKLEKEFFGNLSKGASNSISRGLADSVNTLDEFLQHWADLTGDFRDGNDATGQFVDHMKAAAAAARTVSKETASIPKDLNISIRVTKKDFASAYKTGMEATQSAMADSADAAFDSRWDARIQRAQDAASASEDAQKARHQAALDRIQKQIDAEKNADKIRQQLFEAEKTRLQQLADLQNKQIDFADAVNQGNLDTAAKIQNDMVASNAINEMDAEDKRAQALSDAKQNRLQKRSDALQKLQQKQEAAAQKAHAKQIENMQKERDFQKTMLDQRLELFKAYTARNQKDLERWMKVVGLSYDDFGKATMAKGKTWSEYFRTELSTQVRLAATNIANDKIWATVGGDMALGLLQGMGFPSLASFNKFINTGTLPKNFGAETHHTGGIVGSGGGSRGNVPSNYRGLHPSEVMVRAQKGERIFDTNTSKKYAPIFDAIQNGVMDGVMGGQGVADTGGFDAPNMSGVVAGTIGKLLEVGLSRAFGNAISGALSKGTTGTVASAGAGKYSGTAFSAEQMKNAATIANVGSRMGMNARDIEIGIMTAITESGLRNLHGGDRDSLGLFQQRPSQGWGTPAQVTNPEYAATKFFNALKGVDVKNLSPWMAAQSVQRSAFADGSNYEKWWGAALAIYTKGLTRNKKGFSANATLADYSATDTGYKPGSGGKHRPINVAPTSGIHDVSTGYPALDFAASVGHPIYAVSDGTITRSYDIKGYEPRRASYGKAQDGYKSYGRVVYLHTKSGPEVLYAHLSRRSVAAGTNVRGGSIIGYSGDTGNSTGPHLHFGSAGASPYAWLRRGGTVRWDNTPAMLHRGETVLTEPLTRKLKDNVASGVGDNYTITIDMKGAIIREELDITRAVHAAIDERDKKKGRKKVVR